MLGSLFLGVQLISRQLVSKRGEFDIWQHAYGHMYTNGITCTRAIKHLFLPYKNVYSGICRMSC